jgi:hypothetical protein
MPVILKLVVVALVPEAIEKVKAGKYGVDVEVMMPVRFPVRRLLVG